MLYGVNLSSVYHQSGRVAENLAGFYVLTALVNKVFNSFLRNERPAERGTIKLITTAFVMYQCFPLTDPTFALLLTTYMVTSLVLSSLRPKIGPASASKEQCVKALAQTFKDAWPRAIETAVEIAFLMNHQGQVSVGSLGYAFWLLEETSKKNPRLITVTNVWNMFREKSKPKISLLESDQFYQFIALEINRNMKMEVIPRDRNFQHF